MLLPCTGEVSALLQEQRTQRAVQRKKKEEKKEKKRKNSIACQEVYFHTLSVRSEVRGVGARELLRPGRRVVRVARRDAGLQRQHPATHAIFTQLKAGEIVC